MMTAEELQQQKDSLTPQIKSRLMAMEAKRREDREREEARSARRAAELRESELRRYSGNPAPVTKRWLCPSDHAPQRAFL